jgi:protein sidekick
MCVLPVVINMQNLVLHLVSLSAFVYNSDTNSSKVAIPMRVSLGLLILSIPNSKLPVFQAQRNYLIQDLITWKDYEIQLAATNSKGIGIYSPGIKIKTREGVPNAAPTAMRTEALNSTCIRVWWRPPDPQQINGINQGYKIQAWQGENLKDSVSVPPSPFDPLAEQTGTLCGLGKYEDYNITVLCFTNPGDGRRSTSVPIKTLEDVPEDVSSLHFEEISDRAVKVVWSEPVRTNGELKGYLVRYGVRDIPSSFRNMNLTANSTSVRVTQLKASTYYSFEVCGFTGVGRGSCKSASIKSGVEPVLPSPPFNLAVSNIQPFSVVLQFTPGFDGNSSITKWTVQATTNRNATWHTIFEHCEEPEGSSSGSEAMTLSPLTGPSASGLGGRTANMEFIVVQKLAPYVQYHLRLIAHNVVGPSVPSEPTQMFQSLQAPPAHPPRNVTVRAMSATQLKVRWIVS